MHRVAFFLATILATASAFLAPLHVVQAIDNKRMWRAIITNVSGEKVTTRVKGCVIIKDEQGRELERFKVPLGGFCLDNRESVMTYISKPILCYKEPVIVSSFMQFIDIDDECTAQIYYYRRTDDERPCDSE